MRILGDESLIQTDPLVDFEVILEWEKRASSANQNSTLSLAVRAKVTPGLAGVGLSIIYPLARSWEL